MELIKILIFRIRSRRFALVSKNVKEILDSHGTLITVFYGGRALKGIMNLGGDPVSVLDTPFVLDMKEEGDDPVILFCREKGMERGIGITVSEVKGMELVDSSRIVFPQETDDVYISGFIREDDGKKEITLLDLKKFLDYADTKIARM